MKILVTGSTGYIGSRFTHIAMNRGHTIVAASRRPLPDFETMPFDLENPGSRYRLPEHTDVVVHLAVMINDDGTRQVEAAKALLEAAQKQNAKFVFVSSQTARHDAPTDYGRTKSKIESDVLSRGGFVVRPGMVYGGPEQGLFGTLVRLVRLLPVLPAFFPAPLVQPVHVDDCAQGILAVIENPDLKSGIFCLADPHPISFTDFLRHIAIDRLKARRFFLPIPIAFVRLVLKFLGTNLSMKLGLHSLNSLFDLPALDSKHDLETLNLGLLSLHEGMRDLK